jgi:LysR family glycine cleavage system transcriptional activator
MTRNFLPVCSPRLVLEGPHWLKVSVGLKYHALLHEETVPKWRMWLMVAELEYIHATRGPWFSHAIFLLEAICDSQGVELGDIPLVDDDRAAGLIGQTFRSDLAQRLGVLFGVPKTCSGAAVHYQFLRLVDS